MNETSEEKTLPASEKKIRDARKKGQVLHSPDLISGISILCCTIFLIFLVPRIEISARSMLDEASHIYERPFTEVWHRLSTIAAEELLTTVIPILAITVAASILTNIAITKGFVFSFKPVEPDFERINPASGLKRLFSLKSVVEFGKSSFKILTLATAFVIVFRTGIQALFESPACGGACTRPTFLAMLRPLIVTAMIVFLVVGLCDVFLQRWLFRRDMRMTKTESKREQKDMEGDPLLRRERMRRRRELAGARTGLQNASLLIGDPDGMVVGIRYHRGETPVPIVVCRARGDAARTMLRQAGEQGTPFSRDGELARQIAAGASVGEPIPESCFQRAANSLVAANLI
ncbi:translocation protein in type III secretion system, RhcU [Phyllobacterium salinisoli]|uniref:Translocation protein in type III secretion system, RhcU n=1 Tax=Phyllobacterium salinisoli TaxID=1899321 RepID=A0A368K014_9HYPH|nr:EscU/YscU/HrcU family type III secretion system export apparatus switch protein [Phyllobacterium salinisoli]RCS22729.1 translocation protein in type III secretion system, RhcU [Phyllobacterium salinisoli]